MKRRELIRHLHRQECRLLRQGRRHSVYHNPATHRNSTVPRHTEITDKLAAKICRDLDIPAL